MKISFFLAISVSCIINSAIAQVMDGEQLYKKINNSIVGIFTFDNQGNSLSQGSGVVINSKGWVVTNFHVYEKSSRLIIKHKNTVIKDVLILASDYKRDLLILKIPPNLLPTISIGNSDVLNIGQKIYAIGSPLGLENSISDGIISGIRINDETFKKFIQISSPISPGSSGGALVNTKGELIGITTSTFTKGQNLNFAIPVNDVMRLYSGSGGIKEIQNVSLTNLLYTAQIAYLNGQFDKAISILNKCLLLAPTDASVYANLGVNYSKKKDYKTGISFFKKAISLDKTNSIYPYNLGNAYFFSGQYEEAIRMFKESLKIDPKSAATYYMLGYTYSYGNNPLMETAIEYYKKSILYDPQNPKPYYQIAYMHSRAGDVDIALQNFLKALELNSDEKDIKGEIGQIYLSKGDYSSAERYLKEAVHENNTWGDANFRMGILNNLKKDFNSAQFYYQNALKYYDQSISAFSLNDIYIGLGENYLDLGEKVKAIDFFMKAIAQNTLGDDRAYFSLAMTYQKEKNYEKAVTFYKKAIAENPTNPLSLFNLSLVYRDLKNKALWKYYEDEAAKLDPKYGTKRYLDN